MKTNQFLFYFFMILTNYSCAGNSVDLEKMDFSCSYEALLKDKNIFTEPFDIATKLPVVYIYDTKGFKFGELELPEKCEIGSYKNELRIHLNNTTEQKIVGFTIRIHTVDHNLTEKIMAYLLQVYDKPEVLAPIPERREDGFLMGKDAYFWNLKSKNQSLILSQSYSILTKYGSNKEQQQLITSTIHLIDNDVKPEGISENFDLSSIELLREMYSN